VETGPSRCEKKFIFPPNPFDMPRWRRRCAGNEWEVQISGTISNFVHSSYWFPAESTGFAPGGVGVLGDTQVHHATSTVSSWKECDEFCKTKKHLLFLFFSYFLYQSRRLGLTSAGHGGTRRWEGSDRGSPTAERISEDSIRRYSR